MDVAPVGEVKLIVNVPAEELAVTFVGVPGALEDPPVVTVIVLVGVPKLVPLTALNVIEAGDAVAVPLPNIDGPLGGLGTVIVFQVVPPSELN